MILLVLIILHSGNGIEIDVNTETITHLRHPDPKGSQYFTPDVHCMVNLSDGKFVTVKESCEDVKRLLGKK